ncbi:unnamed protein product [Microthlaspi erraticum]|uniref:Uncharacterized protein n=1 Tax=Microthlaspi erraticum TaxID=1685480 RepID=A0A6D2KZJ9_9BRAS|nr:unnamed protein product [Microthlaspi erraticum]
MVDDQNDNRILWDCGSPLYDSYELVSLTHIIERHFMSLPYLSSAEKLSCSRTPSDLGAKANRAASIVVDVCCSSDSKAGKLLCGVFRTKRWTRKKNANLVVNDYVKKKKKKLFCTILSWIRIPPTPTTSRFGSSKM